MNIIDFIIIIWLGLAIYLGWRSGIIYRIGQLVGLVIGMLVAIRLSEWFTDAAIARIATFQIISILAMIGSGIGAFFLNKAFRVISWLPLLKSANRILGAIVALLLQGIILSIGTYWLQYFNIHTILTAMIDNSLIGTALAKFGKIIITIFLNEYSF